MSKPRGEPILAQVTKVDSAVERYFRGKLGCRNISRLASTDKETGCEQMSETSCKGTGSRGKTPDECHYAHHVFAAPAVYQISRGQGQHGNGHVDDGHQQTELSIAQPHVLLEIGEQRCQHLPVNEIQQKKGAGQKKREKRSPLAYGPGILPGFRQAILFKLHDVSCKN